MDINPGVQARSEGAESVLLGRRLELFGVVAITFAGVILLGATDHLVPGAFNDDGVYLALGKAIASGKGYHSIHMVGDPVQVKYPPGLPLVLAVLWHIGGALPNVMAAVLMLNALIISGAAGILWYHARYHLAISPLLIGPLILGPLFLDAALYYHGLALAEPYFLLGWASALIVAARLHSVESQPARSGLALVLGFTLAITSLFRSHAIVLIPAFLIALALRRIGWRAWLLCAGAAFGPLAVWHFFHGRMLARGSLSPLPDEGAYSEWIAQQNLAETARFVLKAASTNIQAYTSTFAHYVSGVPDIGVALLCALTALAGIGAIQSWRRQPELGLTVLTSVLLVLAWPFTQDRLVLVILPFAGLLAATASSRLLRRSTREGVRYGAVAALLLVAMSISLQQVDLRAEALRRLDRGENPTVYGPAYFLTAISRYLEVAIPWVRESTLPDDRILIEYPAALYLHTGRQGVNSDPAEPWGGRSVFATPGEYLARRIVEDDITVLVLGSTQARIIRDVAVIQRRCPDVLRYLGHGPNDDLPVYFRVFRDEECLRRLVS